MRFLIALLLSVSAWAQLGPMLPDGIPFAGGGGGGSAPTVVQTHIAGGAYATNPSTTIPFTSNVTAGNILVVGAGMNSQVTSWATPTGSGTGCSSTTFTAIGTPSTGSNWGEGAWQGTASGTGSCTVTIQGTTSASQGLSGSGAEVHGGTTTGILVSAYPAEAGCSTCTGQTVGSVPANALMLTFIFSGNTGSPMSVPSPFTFDINTTDAVPNNVGLGEYAFVAGGTYSPTFTVSDYPELINFSVAIPHQ